MEEYKLTKAQEQCLRTQSLTPDQPGTVLHDFRMILDFLGTRRESRPGGNTACFPRSASRS